MGADPTTCPLTIRLFGAFEVERGGDARRAPAVRRVEGLRGQEAVRGGSQSAVRARRRATAAEPSREAAQRALMQALAASGNHVATTEVSRELRLYAHQELNAEPD